MCRTQYISELFQNRHISPHIFWISDTNHPSLNHITLCWSFPCETGGLYLLYIQHEEDVVMLLWCQCLHFADITKWPSNPGSPLALQLCMKRGWWPAESLLQAPCFVVYEKPWSCSAAVALMYGHEAESGWEGLRVLFNVMCLNVHMLVHAHLDHSK